MLLEYNESYTHYLLGVKTEDTSVSWSCGLSDGDQETDGDPENKGRIPHGREEDETPRAYEQAPVWLLGECTGAESHPLEISLGRDDMRLLRCPSA